MHYALTFKSDYFDLLLCTSRHTHVSMAFTILPGLSEMLFTKQEKGQENQASQQKSLSSPKKEPLSSQRVTVLIGTLRIVKWASPAPFACQSPSSRRRRLLQPCCCGNKWPGCAGASASDITRTQARLWASSLAPQQHHCSKISAIPPCWNRDKAQGTGPGRSARHEPWNQKGSR